MALTRVQINQKSDEKRGVKTKGFKLHINDIVLIEQASKDLNNPQSQLLIDAVNFHLENKKSPQRRAFSIRFLSWLI